MMLLVGHTEMLSTLQLPHHADASYTHTQGICFATQHCLNDKMFVHANLLCRFTFSFSVNIGFSLARDWEQLSPLSEILDTPALP